MGRHGRCFLAIGLALLDGCSLPAPPLAPIADTRPLSPTEEYCRGVARERADDAVANGYGFDIQDGVFRETYDNCIEWQMRDQHR